jgi:hypothetical protein
MLSELNLLPKARRSLATIAYHAEAIALYVHGLGEVLFMWQCFAFEEPRLPLMWAHFLGS